ncbi:ABC transporter ATP-binding protein [Bergeyella sp. RCAD1439]|uniref:ABC transporter ATP-binding protein n=1 Tax=Bergeyella anatis TaxID=3113737 RepID=UPI002E186064|nr:ABC transporter ATP-binding protein [Bergeyella sp. RCAD1439]
MAKVNHSQKLWSFLSSEKKDIANIYFYAILSGLVSLSVPLGIQAIINYTFGATMVTSIYILIALVTFGTFLYGYFQVRVMEIIEKIQQKIFVHYAMAFAEKLPKINLTYANQYYLPELVNRFFDTQNLQKGLSKLLLDLPVALIQIVFGLILLSFYHPYFIFFSIFILIVVALIFYFTKDQGIETSLEESHHKYDIASWLEEVSRDLKTFKNNAFLQAHTEETNKKLIRYLDYRTSHFKVLLFQYKTIIFFKVLITLAMLLLGTYLLLNQKLNIGAFIATEIVVLTIMTAVEKLIKSLEKYYDIVTSFTKLSKILDLKEETSGLFLPEEKQDGFEVQAQELTFGFDQNAPLIRNLNFSFPKNTITLITGRQGSGKSLLIHLISGLYEPFSGRVFLDKIPIQNFQSSQLRKHIGLYSNDLEVFKGNILENINLGNPTVSNQNIIEIAERIGLENFAGLFKEGLLTEIQTADRRLAYSTKKLILLLRSFVGTKRLLLLEDPLEGFSPEIKAKMKTFLKELAQHRTIIIIGAEEDYQALSHQAYRIQEGQLHQL